MLISTTGWGPVIFDPVVVGGGGGVGVVVVGGICVVSGGGVGVVGGGAGVVVFGGQPRQWFWNTPVSLSRHVAYFPWSRWHLRYLASPLVKFRPHMSEARPLLQHSNIEFSPSV